MRPLHWIISSFLLLAGTTAIAQEQGGGIPEPGPILIADQILTEVALDGIQQNNAEITGAENASFIKVHFDYLKLPEGMQVEVSNADGSEVYRYGTTERDDYTVDENLGENGVYSFGSMSITGERVFLRLVGSSDETFGGEKDYGVYVSQVTEGFSEEWLELTYGQAYTGRSTCGSLERRDAVCYENSHPTEFDRARAVGRLLLTSSLCTAWRVGDGNHLFTNNHCMSSASAVAASEVWFNYQRTSCGGSTNGTTVKVSGNTMFKTDFTLDYTLFSVSNFSSIQSFGNLGLDVRSAVSGEEIYIPQHGSGNPKELAIESDQNSGNICRVDLPSTNGRGTNTDIGYLCDTIGGSSGSPVLARSSHKVIALHHLGGCHNKGAKISLIWPQVSDFFNNQIPVGSGGGTTTNQAPTAGFTSSTNDLTASFTDTSSDSDGTIASRAWNFGDGGTSTATNPSHTYASAGTYTVSLTVTDDGGATDNFSAQVTVTSGGSGSNSLTNGQTVSGIGESQGDWVYYTLDVPAGASNLNISISGGSGDADLYTRFGAQPTTSTYDCRPFLNGNNETCTNASPQAGTWHIGIRAYRTFSNASLTVSFTEPGSGGTNGGSTVNDVAATRGNWVHYTLEVPAGMDRLEVEISGGSGDADLYIRFGQRPTTSSYDHRPFLNGNNESVTINNPQAGTWHISVRAYRTFSGVTLDAYYFQ